MNWQAIGAMGELVGALAVVVSLIYLAIQIRQNSKLLRSAAQDSVSLKYAQTMNMITSTPEGVAVFHKGLLQPRDLTPEQVTHFFLLMNNSFIQMDYTLQLHLDSNLSKERWAQLFQGAEYYMASPGGRFYWKTYGRQFNHLPGSEFVRLVDAAYEKHEPLALDEADLIS